MTNPVTGRTELHSVPDDPEQRHDIAARHPDRVRGLKKQLEEWRRALSGYATAGERTRER